MKLMGKLAAVCALVFVVVVGAWLILDGTDHIEDTNGPDNFALQTITDEEIINMSIGSIGGPNISKDTFMGDSVKFSASKFTGVYEILYDNYIGTSDFEINLSSFAVSEGNFKLVVVHNNEIVATLEPDIFVNYRLEDITGYISLRIVGESAAFSFNMSQLEYDFHTHPNT